MNLIAKSWLPALVVSLVCMAVAGIAVGGAGVAGAAAGAVIVSVFFASSPLVLGPILKVTPHLSVSVALTFFFTKVVALVALLYVVVNPDGAGKNIDANALGGTVIVCTLVWTVLQIRAATKSRTPMYDLDSDR